jgi:hypothetical protein
MQNACDWVATRGMTLLSSTSSPPATQSPSGSGGTSNVHLQDDMGSAQKSASRPFLEDPAEIPKGVRAVGRP